MKSMPNSLALGLIVAVLSNTLLIILLALVFFSITLDLLVIVASFGIVFALTTGLGLFRLSRPDDSPKLRKSMLLSLIVIYGSFASEFFLVVEGNSPELIDAFVVMMFGVSAFIASIATVVLSPRHDAESRKQSARRFDS